MSDNLLPEAPQTEGVDPLTTGQALYGRDTIQIPVVHVTDEPAETVEPVEPVVPVVEPTVSE